MSSCYRGVIAIAGCWSLGVVACTQEPTSAPSASAAVVATGTTTESPGSERGVITLTPSLYQNSCLATIKLDRLYDDLAIPEDIYRLSVGPPAAGSNPAPWMVIVEGRNLSPDGSFMGQFGGLEIGILQSWPLNFGRFGGLDVNCPGPLCGWTFDHIIASWSSEAGFTTTSKGWKVHNRCF